MKVIKIIGRIALVVVITLLLLLTFSYKWGVKEFSSVNIETILFQLSVPLKGTASTIMESYRKEALFPALKVSVIVFVLLCIYWRFISFDYFLRFNGEGDKKREIRMPIIRFPVAVVLLGLVIWIESLWIYVDRAFGLNEYIEKQSENSDFIEKEYVNPEDVNISFPEKKRNLIWIIMESAESSAQSEADGGIQVVNYIPEMTEIAKENVSFSQSDLIEGAYVTPGCGWTIGGIVSETAGIPLKLPIGNNSMNRYEKFMPKLNNMGEILNSEGYHNVFMCGSDLNFGGRQNYFYQHGDYEKFDLNTARELGKIDENYYVWWGFEDQKLYSYAREKITELSQKEEPFNFTVLTVDTHHPEGYVCSICPNKYGSQYGNVWSCASSQVYEFLNWIQEQAFYDNTTVVITGDHLSMNVTFYKGLDSSGNYGEETKRKVYNAFINPAAIPEKEKNRRFTTLDMFPTILASLGAEIEGDRLGLGTNLFSGRETLSEEFGYEFIRNELPKKSVFYKVQSQILCDS